MEVGGNLVQQLAASRQDPPSRYVQREEDRPMIDAASKSPHPVPVIDLSHLFESSDGPDEAEKLRQALQSWGLFLAVGHEIPTSFLDELRNVTREFFHLPIEEKMKYTNLINGKEFKSEGYGNDKVATEDQILDWVDRLYLLVQPEAERSLSLWPEKPNSFRKILHDFTIKSKKVVEHVLTAMVKILELQEDCFVNKFSDKAITYARFSYYPCCTRPDLVFGIKPHSDASVITILLPDKDVGGLQVLKDGEWINIPTVPDALLINMGDGMEILSNGIFKSPVHRVVTNAENERMSLTMFYALELEEDLEPAQGLVDEKRPRLYRTVKTKDYLNTFYGTFAQGKRAIDWAKI